MSSSMNHSNSMVTSQQPDTSAKRSRKFKPPIAKPHKSLFKVQGTSFKRNMPLRFATDCNPSPQNEQATLIDRLNRNASTGLLHDTSVTNPEDSNLFDHATADANEVAKLLGKDQQRKYALQNIIEPGTPQGWSPSPIQQKHLQFEIPPEMLPN